MFRMSYELEILDNVHAMEFPKETCEYVTVVNMQIIFNLSLYAWVFSKPIGTLSSKQTHIICLQILQISLFNALILFG